MSEILDERHYSSENGEFPLVADFTINELLIEALDKKASDVHITVGMPPLMRINGLLTKMRDYILEPEHTECICNGLMNETQKKAFLAAILEDLATGQKNLQDELLANQTASFTALATENTSALDQIKTRYLDSVSQQSYHQQEVLQEMQEKVLAASNQISETVADLAQVQKDVQATALADLANQITENLSTSSLRQEETLTTFQTDWAKALDQLSNEVVTGLARIDDKQQEGLASFGKTHLEAVTSLAEQQSRGVEELLGHFSGQVSSILADYLDPVTDRFRAASEVLINSQTYASDIQETLARQKDQTVMLEESIRDVLGQFVETRQRMMADITSLEQSTKGMSESAATMSAIYSGSQTGLNDAISRMSDEMFALSDTLKAVVDGSAEQARQVQEQASETYDINRQQLASIREQVDILTGELSTRIDQLMVGFTQLTEELVSNVQKSIDSQNSQLGGGLQALTESMSEEARSMSLYAQGINMDIGGLSSSLTTSITDFAGSIDLQLNTVLERFDKETADILRRLAVAAAEIGDAVEVLPDALRVLLLESDRSEA